MDAALVITTEWLDRNLAWKTGKTETVNEGKVRTNNVKINSIRADKSQVWVPEIEVLNRVNDFSHRDEKQRQVEIKSNGRVRHTRSYRMRSMLSSSLAYYPYDLQVKNNLGQTIIIITLVCRADLVVVGLFK